MKKLFLILAVAALIASCDDGWNEGWDDGHGNDGGVHKIVVGSNELFINPDEWTEYEINGAFDHYYHDFNMPEITSLVLNYGFYHTYWEREEDDALVQEGEGATMYKSYEDNDTGEMIYYSETITCDYSLGLLRVHFRTSDFTKAKPADRLYFRFVALY